MDSSPKHTIQFPQKFKINFTSIRRNVRSNVQKRVLITEVKRLVWGTYYQISTKVQNRFYIDSQKCQVRRSKKGGHNTGETSGFGTLHVNVLSNFHKNLESISHRFAEMLSQTLKKVPHNRGEPCHFQTLHRNILSVFYKNSETIPNRLTEKFDESEPNPVTNCLREFKTNYST